MDSRKKDSLLENLAAAAVLGVLALLIASLSFVFDTMRVRREGAMVASFAGAKEAGSPVRTRDSAFSTLYPMNRRGRQYWGTVATFKDRSGVARVTVLVSADGSLDSASTVDAVPSGIAFGREGWFAEFLGKGGSLPYPSRREELKKPDVVAGATESFEVTTSVLERLSRQAQEATAGRAKD